MSCAQAYDAVELYLDKEKMRKEGAVRQNSKYGDDCKAMFKLHLDSLVKLPMYEHMERKIENQTGASAQGGGVEGREAE